nr:hypothetical protein [Bacilli bacterium]
MDQLALVESQSVRNEYIGRVSVLDKVKALVLLPDDLHATVEMVSEFYGVGVEAIVWHIRNNREELEQDGLTVLTGDRLSEFKAETGFSSRAGSLTVIPRRAILRIGMLLRDSEVAKQVRTYLLDAEQGSNKVDLAKVLRLVEQTAKINRQLGQSKPTAYASAIKFVQGKTGYDLSDFAAPQVTIETQNLVAHALAHRAIYLDPQGSVPKTELFQFLAGYAEMHNLQKLSAVILKRQLVQVVPHLRAKRQRDGMKRSYAWVGLSLAAQ